MVDRLRSVVAFKDPNVIAFSSHISRFLSLPFIMVITLIGLLYIVVSWSDKIPIFGNPKVDYGKDPWRKDYYPLFDSRRKAVKRSASDVRLHKTIIRICVVAMALSFCMTPFGICGRNSLYYDNGIASFNVINRQTGKYYRESDYSHLMISAYHQAGGSGGGHWSYSITIKMSDGKEFSFSNADFDHNMEHYKELCLQKMLDIKRSFNSDDITIKGANHLDDVAEFIGLDDNHRELLYELFSR